ncbi:type II secretion system minor pseudopilin GspJ [Colwelliaceae bacterium 6441]
MFKTPFSCRQGFTLIEVLLAIAIFAMISLASFSIFDGVIKSEQISKAKMDRLNDIQRAWLVIERDFLQIAQRSIRIEGDAPLTGFIHTENDAFSSNNEAIAFVRHGWTNPGLLIPRSDIQSVAYRIEDNTLERLHYNFVDAVVGEEPKIRKLLNEIKSFTIEYFYKNSWQKELIENLLPQAILIRIETDDFGMFERKFIVASNVENSGSNTRGRNTEQGSAVKDNAKPQGDGSDNRSSPGNN